MFMGPRNWCQGMNSASLCSLAGRNENPIPPRCLVPIDFLKIPALISSLIFLLYPGVLTYSISRFDLIFRPCPDTLTFFHLSFLHFPSSTSAWLYLLCHSSFIFSFCIDLLSFSHFLFPHFPFLHWFALIFPLSLPSFSISTLLCFHFPTSSSLIFHFFIDFLSFSHFLLPSFTLTTLICFHFSASSFLIFPFYIDFLSFSQLPLPSWRLSLHTKWRTQWKYWAYLFHPRAPLQCKLYTLSERRLKAFKSFYR